MISTTHTWALGAAAVGLAAGSFLLGPAGASDDASAPANGNHKMAAAQSEARVGADRFGPWKRVPPGENRIARATCPTGRILTGGGGATSGFDIFFTDSYRSIGKTWLIRGTNTGTSAQRIRAFARCV